MAFRNTKRLYKKTFRLFRIFRHGPLTAKRSFFLIGILLFLYCYGIGDYGIYHYFVKLNKVKQLQDEVEQLSEEREQLTQYKMLLMQDDLLTIERVAREKYGMVKKGETFVRIVFDDGNGAHFPLNK